MPMSRNIQALCLLMLMPVEFDRAPPDYWQLTHDGTVVIGTVLDVTDHVSIKVEQVLKGQGISGTLSFPTPPPPPKGLTHAPFWTFQPAERWILFLKTPALRTYTLEGGASGQEVPRVAQSVRESLAFDALRDDRSRCAFLVQAIAGRGRPYGPSIQRLDQCNRAEFLSLLAPLATDEFGKRIYWRLLASNPNPQATELLRTLAHTEQPPLLCEVIDALGRRDGTSGALSKELMSYLTHADPRVRQSAVFILGYRDHRPAFREIVLRLKDPDPAVRANALAWPWYAYVKEHPDVTDQIKDMRSDPDPQVRSSAKRALAGISPWYRSWY